MKKGRTISAKASEVLRKWYLIDAKDNILGRISTKAATLLRGKHKEIYTPHVDTGDFVIIINAELVKVTGNKEEDKIYFTHSYYPRGDRQVSLRDMRAKKPEEILRHAIKGMLPRGALGSVIFKKLKVYRGSTHPHKAQNPTEIKI